MAQLFCAISLYHYNMLEHFQHITLTESQKEDLLAVQSFVEGNDMVFLSKTIVCFYQIFNLFVSLLPGKRVSGTS